MRRYKDRESFITLARRLHGGKYSYENFQYNGKNVPGEIICPVHGSFWQTPSVHVNSRKPSGCPLCANQEKCADFDVFIEKARKIHGDDYEYDRKDYVNMRTKMKIYCKKHKQYFFQTPNNHVHKSNPTKCPLCAAENVIEKNRSTFEEFVRKAKSVHGDEYEYFSEKYVNAITKLDIKCNNCGRIFEQTPHTHLSGKGCPFCRKSNMEKQTMKVLETMKIRYEHQKTFDWLLFKRQQYLDFYLPEYNIAIECQGEQHYKPVDFSHQGNIQIAEQNLVKNQVRDKNKKDLCQKHGIKLIYVTYKDKISEKLPKLIEENKEKTIYK